MVDPIILPECGHTYCNSCITKLRESSNQNEGRVFSCPNCCTPITSAALKTNFTVSTLVAKVRAKCSRCQSEDSIEKLVSHKCPEVEVDCSNEGCGMKIKRKDQRTHGDNCLYKAISCDRCRHSTTLANLEVHMDHLCQEGVISCPLKCKSRPKRYDLKYF